MTMTPTSKPDVEQLVDDDLESSPQRPSKEVAAFDEVFYASTSQHCRPDEMLQFDLEQPFENDQLTNFLIDENQSWIKQIIDRWQAANIEPIPLQIDGNYMFGTQAGLGKDPSRPYLTVAYRYALSQREHIEHGLEAALLAARSWKERALEERRTLLIDAAHKLAQRRGHLIGASLLDAGKTIEQADAEVSEAIDIANYYARISDSLDAGDSGIRFEPFGVVLIVPPRNMPLGVAAGNILAAILAGNSVILKPSLETVLVAWELSKTLWEAGIPKSVLQFLPTQDDEIGERLVSDKRIGAVILTGSYDTARQFLAWRPDMRLIAETGGKNSMIVTPSADREMAIKDIVYSAFGHNGLKSSASGIAILVKEVYDDPDFMDGLREAAEALFVGSAWDTRSLVTPLIREPDEVLTRAQEELEPWETWLLEPQIVDGNPNLWSPGIKMGIRPGSFYHTHECFGPMLGLMRAEDTAHALALANMSEFGLTTSIHSREKEEIELALLTIEAGNVYVNRNTTHTLVERQPFGGWKKSSFGMFSKAGGPNYLMNLGQWTENRANLPGKEDLAHELRTAWETHFSSGHGRAAFRGEMSLFQYQPIRSMVVRVQSVADVEGWTYHLLLTCAELSDVPIIFSVSEDEIMSDLPSGCRVVYESEAALALRIGLFERVRYLGQPSLEFLKAAHDTHVSVISDPLTMNGHLELRYFLREQTLSQRTFEEK